MMRCSDKVAHGIRVIQLPTWSVAAGAYLARVSEQKHATEPVQLVLYPGARRTFRSNHRQPALCGRQYEPATFWRSWLVVVSVTAPRVFVRCLLVFRGRRAVVFTAMNSWFQ